MPAETEAKDFPCRSNADETSLLVVSQSGKQKDVIHISQNWTGRGVTTMSVEPL
jgi:DNA-binding MurR/RpiR family transcriptional regulator